MFYLVIGLLLLVGALAALLIDAGVYTKVEARVLESREEFVRKESEFTKMTIQHAVAYMFEGKEKIAIVDSIPVRETDGATVKLKINKKSGEPMQTIHDTLMPLTLCMLLAGLVSLVIGLHLLCGAKNMSFESLILYLPLLFGFTFVAMLLYDLVSLLNPRVIHASGKYEGIMHHSAEHRLMRFYSLWYGNYRQYGRCPGGLFIQKSEKAAELYYDTLRGTVIRKADIIINACLACVIIILLFLYLGMIT